MTQMRLPHIRFMHGLFLYGLLPKLISITAHPHFSTIHLINLAFHSDALQLDERILNGIDFLVIWRPV